MVEKEKLNKLIWRLLRGFQEGFSDCKRIQADRPKHFRGLYSDRRGQRTCFKTAGRGTFARTVSQGRNVFRIDIRKSFQCSYQCRGGGTLRRGCSNSDGFESLFG